MDRIKRYILFMLLALSFLSCTEEKDNCELFSDMNSSEIEYYFTHKIPKEKLHEYLYSLGECKVVNSIPYLIKCLDNKKISHDIRHKGMSVRYIAIGSLCKITNKDLFFKQNDTEELKVNIINSWKKTLK